MDPEQGVVGAVRIVLVGGQPTPQMKRGVQSQGGMAFRQNESIPVGIVGAVGFQRTLVQRGEYSRDRERRPDVSEPGAPRLFEHDPADLVCRNPGSKWLFGQSGRRKNTFR